jgi:hypothetical protein
MESDGCLQADEASVFWPGDETLILIKCELIPDDITFPDKLAYEDLLVSLLVGEGLVGEGLVGEGLDGDDPTWSEDPIRCDAQAFVQQTQIAAAPRDEPVPPLATDDDVTWWLAPGPVGDFAHVQLPGDTTNPQPLPSADGRIAMSDGEARPVSDKSEDDSSSSRSTETAGDDDAEIPLDPLYGTLDAWWSFEPWGGGQG